MLPLLVPLVAQLAPGLVDWLFGSKAASATTAVVRAVQATTGADATTADGMAAVQTVLASKPDVALQLQAELLTIRAQLQAEADRAAESQRAADLAEMRAAIEDTASARAQTVALAQSHSPVAYGAAVVSIVVLLMFAIMAVLVATRALPGDNNTLVTGILVSLQTMAAGVVSYWTGSSIGSVRKDATLAHLATVQSAPAPAP